MVHPVLVIADAVANDYTSLISHVLKENAGLSRLDLFIQSPIDDATTLNNILSQYYFNVRAIATDQGYDYTFEINVLFNKQIDNALTSNWNVVFKHESENISLPPGVKLVNISHDTAKIAPQAKTLARGKSPKHYSTVALGGTFDHVHDGHKVLLSVAAYLTKTKLIVGITGPELLTNKKFAKVLQPFTERQQSVLEFLALVSNPRDFSINIYAINDVCGPTGFISDIDALVLSSESSKGGDFVNNYRSERNFKALDLITIRVIGSEEANEENGWKGKLSSTDIREQILKKK